MLNASKWVAGLLWERWRMVAVAATLAALLALAWLGDAPARALVLLEWVQGMGRRGIVLYVLLYMVAAVAFVPGSILVLGAGAVYGLALGFAVAAAGSTLGATAAFITSRYWARGWMRRLIKGHPSFQAIDRAIGYESWRIVLLIRLSPIFPYNLLNYAFGMTRVPLGAYVAGSAIGNLPATLLYVYFGSLLGSLTALRDEPLPVHGWRQWTLYGFGLLATAAVCLYLARLARRAVKGKIKI